MPTKAIRASCYWDEASLVQVEGVFAAFCDSGFEPGKTFCARAETVYANPPDATAPLVNSVNGKIVVINRGGNTFFDKAQHAANAGAAGVIFVDDNDKLAAVPEQDGAHVRIPCVIVRKSWLSAPGARVGAVWTITIATIGPSGTVDFQALVEGWKDANQKFEDHAFPANLNSIFFDPRRPQFICSAADTARIVWKRPEELHASPVLFDNDAVPDDIIQGSLGDCYLLSAAGILCSDSANDKAKQILQKLFVKTKYFADGLVGIRIFKDGKWFDLAVDTRIPCMGNAPLCVKMKDLNEFWIIMLEKAYAKMYGVYEQLDGGHIDEALEDLTGGAPGRVSIVHLFQNAMGRDGHVDKLKAMQLLEKRAHGELFQGASCDGGTEEAIGNGLYAGHAYSILSVKKTSTGEILVCMRNPWGRLEWTGAWGDKDTARWTPALKAEMGFTDEDDGTFHMSIGDFVKHFTTCTFVDLVPPSFFIYRVEGRWTQQTAGGCVNHASWHKNPQLRIQILKPTDLTITMSQPDGNLKAGRTVLFEYYEHAVGFALFKTSKRLQRWSDRQLVKETDYLSARSVSMHMKAVPPGEYMIVPTTFDPCQMEFYMRFFCSNDIGLVDSSGQNQLQIYAASDDQLDKQDVPITLDKAMAGLALAQAEEEAAAGEEEAPTHHVKKKTAEESIEEDFDFVGMLQDVRAVDTSSWTVGNKIPAKWEAGSDYVFAADNNFSLGEIVAVTRSDRSVRFAKVTEGAVACPGKHLLGSVDALPRWTCDVCRSEATPGEKLHDCRICDWDACEACVRAADKGVYSVDVGNGMTKVGMPAQYIGKLPSAGGIPHGLHNKISAVFDVLDADGSGFLEVKWGNSELAGDIGKRLLAEMKVPKESQADMYAAMKSLDSDGDGRIDRAEFITWFARRALAAAS